MKAVKLSIPSLRRHVMTQAPSKPSVSNNMLTLTNVTGRRKIQTASRIRMSPRPFSRPVPAMWSQPRIKGMSGRAATGRPSQGTRPLQARKKKHELGDKQHIKMHAPAKQGSTQPNRRSTNATTSNMHQTPQLFRRSQRVGTSDPTIGNFSNSKIVYMHACNFQKEGEQASKVTVLQQGSTTDAEFKLEQRQIRRSLGLLKWFHGIFLYSLIKPLHRPYLLYIYIYVVGSSNLGSWNGHWNNWPQS